MSPLGPAASAELVIVDLIAKHDVEAHEQLAREGDPRFRPAPAVQPREVQALEVGIGPCGQRSGLAEDPAEQRAALLGDVAESALVSGGADGGGQTDVAHDMLAVGETIRGPQDEHGGERRQGGRLPDA